MLVSLVHLSLILSFHLKGCQCANQKKDGKCIPPGITRDWAMRPVPPNKASTKCSYALITTNQVTMVISFLQGQKMWRWANRNFEVLQKLPKKSGDDRPLTKAKWIMKKYCLSQQSGHVILHRSLYSNKTSESHLHRIASNWDTPSSKKQGGCSFLLGFPLQHMDPRRTSQHLQIRKQRLAPNAGVAREDRLPRVKNTWVEPWSCQEDAFSSTCVFGTACLAHPWKLAFV